MAKIQLTVTSAQAATLKSVAANNKMTLSALILASLAFSLHDPNMLPANTPNTRPHRGTRQARKQATHTPKVAQEHSTRDALIRKALRDRETASILNGIVRK